MIAPMIALAPVQAGPVQAAQVQAGQVQTSQGRAAPIQPALPQAEPGAAATPDITVVGARLRKIRLQADTNKKGLITRCAVTVSSGAIAFDRAACEATRACAAAGRKTSDAMTDCVDRRLIAFVNGPAGPDSGDGNNARN